MRYFYVIFLLVSCRTISKDYEFLASKNWEMRIDYADTIQNEQALLSTLSKTFTIMGYEIIKGNYNKSQLRVTFRLSSEASSNLRNRLLEMEGISNVSFSD